MNEGKFRQDLLYRLNVCPIYIPPLRERVDDIIPLAENFIKDQNIKFRKNIQGLDKQAKKIFLQYDWPGNVRELRNAIERAMIFEDEGLITAQYLPIQHGVKSKIKSIQTGRLSKTGMGLREMEKDMILNALQRANGNKSQAAKILNITRDTLRYKLKKFSVEPADYTSH